MRVDLFDFELPQSRIALRPAQPRESARLLIVPPDGEFVDQTVKDWPNWLRAGDLVVLNETRVIPAALRALRIRGVAGSVSSGSSGNAAADPVPPRTLIQINLHQSLSDGRWSAFAKPGRRLAPGDGLDFLLPGDEAPPLDALRASLLEKRAGGEIVIQFDRSGKELEGAINRFGQPPLPPYIAQARRVDAQDELDYQTVFARKSGSVAAPTAGLHLTRDLLQRLTEIGVETVCLDLEVGAGTFLPMKSKDTADHIMHGETYSISQACAAAVNRARSEGRRVIAVGTTVLRALESAALAVAAKSVHGADFGGKICAGSARTQLFVTPGFPFRCVDALLTNFHLPRSTLFMLVCALIGTDRAQAAIAHAIRSDYRFYSYGDAMFCPLKAARIQDQPAQTRGKL